MRRVIVERAETAVTGNDELNALAGFARLQNPGYKLRELYGLRGDPGLESNLRPSRRKLPKGTLHRNATDCKLVNNVRCERESASCRLQYNEIVRSIWRGTCPQRRMQTRGFHAG